MDINQGDSALGSRWRAGGGYKGPETGSQARSMTSSRARRDDWPRGFRFSTRAAPEPRLWIGAVSLAHTPDLSLLPK